MSWCIIKYTCTLCVRVFHQLQRDSYFFSIFHESCCRKSERGWFLLEPLDFFYLRKTTQAWKRLWCFESGSVKTWFVYREEARRCRGSVPGILDMQFALTGYKEQGVLRDRRRLCQSPCLNSTGWLKWEGWGLLLQLSHGFLVGHQDQSSTPHSQQASLLCWSDVSKPKAKFIFNTSSEQHLGFSRWHPVNTEPGPKSVTQNPPFEEVDIAVTEFYIWDACYAVGCLCNLSLYHTGCQTALQARIDLLLISCVFVSALCILAMFLINLNEYAVPHMFTMKRNDKVHRVWEAF